MPRPAPVVPPYRHHKARDLAYTLVAGRKIYLGRYGSPESKSKHARIVREAATGQPVGRTDRPAVDPEAVTVAGVLAAFWAHAKTTKTFDPAEEGKRPNGELGNYFDVIKVVMDMYAGTPALQFGPNALRLVQEEMIARGWCRNVVNRQTCRITHMFGVAVSLELIPETHHRALLLVPGVRRDHKGVRNTEDVEPVAMADLKATLPFLSPRIRAMVKLQFYTGMRSTNLCEMQTADVDRSRPKGFKAKAGPDGKRRRWAWRYSPRRHKTAHHGHKLVIPLGPKARKVLRPYLKPDRPQAFIFSPADEAADRRAERAAARTTPLSCGNRPGSKPAKRSPKRRPGERYDRRTYAQAITRACDRADAAAKRERLKAGDPVPDDVRLVNRWHPHQLRHNRATIVRERHGLDGVQAVLGQKTRQVAERYGKITARTADRVAAELG
jgi:integrase